MNLILTSRERLQAIYGARGPQRVVAALRPLLAARRARGISSQLLWAEDGIPRLGVPGAIAEPLALVRQLGQIAAALGPAQQIESLLIIGGPDIVPFYEAPNPVSYDGDAHVPSDCYYSARGPFAMQPEWPVGRIPGPADGDLPALLQLIRHAASQPPATPHSQQKRFGYCTAVWRGSASYVFAEIGDSGALLISPPAQAATLDRRRMDQAQRIYCNLHGVSDGPLWYGQASDSGAMVVALGPGDVEQIDLRGAVIVSEACYGATIAGRTAGDSIALAMLMRGAAGFLGASALSYGPGEPPASEADLIALHFLRALRRPGATLGGALLAAQNGLLRDTLDTQDTLDEDDQKTLLEFMLFGDPTLAVG